MPPGDAEPLLQPPEAAVAIVHARAPEEAVLLIRRASRPGDPWSGHWSFPGGRCEPGDEGLLATALRELEEECGVRLEAGACRRALPFTHAGRHYGRLMVVAPFVFEVDQRPPLRLDLDEAVAATWLPLAEFRDGRRHGVQTGLGIPDGRRVAGLLLEGVPLWGFTYRVLCDWLAVPAAAVV